MNSQSFEERLRMGKVNCLVYSKDGKDGLISVWINNSSFILTWEECPKGKQYDESTYTRDDRHVFSNYSDLLFFLKEQNLQLNQFKNQIFVFSKNEILYGDAYQKTNNFFHYFVSPSFFKVLGLSSTDQLGAV